MIVANVGGREWAGTRTRCTLTPGPSPRGRGEIIFGLPRGSGSRRRLFPKALEHALRIILPVPGDEVDVAPQGLVQ